MFGARDPGTITGRDQRGDVRGRGSTTALLAVLAAMMGNDLFADVRDLPFTVIRFILVVFATSALTAELTRQAQRGGGDPASRWARTDTAIIVTLLLLAALLTASFAVAHAPVHEHTAAACFTALFVMLAGYFRYVRWKNLPKR